MQWLGVNTGGASEQLCEEAPWILGSCVLSALRWRRESLKCAPDNQPGSEPAAHAPARMVLAPPLWAPPHPKSRTPVHMPKPHPAPRTPVPFQHRASYLRNGGNVCLHEAALPHFNISVKILIDLCIAPFSFA